MDMDYRVRNKLISKTMSPRISDDAVCKRIYQFVLSRHNTFLYASLRFDEQIDLLSIDMYKCADLRYWWRCLEHDTLVTLTGASNEHFLQFNAQFMQRNFNVKLRWASSLPDPIKHYTFRHIVSNRFATHWRTIYNGLEARYAQNYNNWINWTESVPRLQIISWTIFFWFLSKFVCAAPASKHCVDSFL